MAESQNNSDQSFSFEDDITPLRRQYFDIARNTGLPVSAQAQLVRSSIAQMQGEEAKDLELKQRAVTFESTKLELEKARQEYSSRTRDMDALNRLKSDLEFAITGVPENDQRKVTSVILMNNADLITRNPIAKSIADSASKGLAKSSSSQNTLVKGLMDDLDKVKFAKNYSNQPIDQFEDAGSEGIVSTFIDVLGTPEIQQQAANATAKQKLDLARKMRSEYYKSQLTGGQPQQPQTQSPRSLYAPQGAPSQ